MDMLKTYFPYSFKAKNDITALVVDIIIYVVIGLVAGLVLGLLSKIPLIGILFSIVNYVIYLYLVVSLVLSVLDYLKIIK